MLATLTRETSSGFAECCLAVGNSILHEPAPKDERGCFVYVIKEDKRHMVLNLLVEGNSIRSTERITGVHRDTIMRLLVRAGELCLDFMDGRMRGLELNHIEIDEIWTFVKVKQAHIPDGRNDAEIGDQYLFV